MRIVRYLTPTIFAGILTLLPSVSLAATSDGLSTTESSIGALLPVITLVYSLIIQLMIYAVQILDFFLKPEVMLAITNPPGGGVNPLLEVWQVSRDLVNIMFALLLVSVAIYTIFRADFTKAKEYASKFVLAVILVNFSWFGPRVVLDFANVLTSTIYYVPSIATPSGEVCTNKDTGGACVIIEDVIPYEESAARVATSGDLQQCYTNRNNTNTNVAGYIIVNNNTCLKLVELDPNDQAGLMQGLIVNYTNILYAGRLPTNFASGTINGNPAKIAMFIEYASKLLLNFVLTAALAFPIMAMTVILFVRIFILWMTIAFMPFAFIGFLIGDKLGSANPMQIWTQFWKNALLPAVLAIPIAVGFIMLNSLLACPFGGSPDPKLVALCGNKNIPVVGIPTWWHLIWQIMAIGVIYMGFFTVTKFTTISEKIGGFFNSLGNLAFKAPLALPLPTGIKAPDGGSQTILGLGKALNASNVLSRMNQGNTLPESITGRDEMAGRLKDVPTRLDSSSINALKTALQGIKNAPESGRPAAITSLKSVMERQGFKTDRSNVERLVNHTDLNVNLGALKDSVIQKISRN